MAIHVSLELILREIEDAYGAGRWYVALATTLSLPDICASLEDDPKSVWANQKKYTAWFDANAQSRFKWLTGEDCYRLRGGVLHNGKLGHPKSAYDRLVFTLPEGGFSVGESLMEINSEKVLAMSLRDFCSSMADAVRTWAAQNSENPNVNENYETLVSLRPDGLAPFFVGFPVIA